MIYDLENSLSKESLTENESAELEAEKERIEEAYRDHASEAATSRTYEALEVSIDKDGRLLSICYQYDTPPDNEVPSESEEIKSLIHYFLIELEQADSDLISFPE